MLKIPPAREQSPPPLSGLSQGLQLCPGAVTPSSRAGSGCPWDTVQPGAPYKIWGELEWGLDDKKPLYLTTYPLWACAVGTSTTAGLQPQNILWTT